MPKPSNPELPSADVTQYIEEAAKAEQPAKPKKPRKSRDEAGRIGVMVYFYPELLVKVDAERKRRHMSRSGWVQLMLTDLLEEKES